MLSYMKLNYKNLNTHYIINQQQYKIRSLKIVIPATFQNKKLFNNYYIIIINYIYYYYLNYLFRLFNLDFKSWSRG